MRHWVAAAAVVDGAQAFFILKSAFGRGISAQVNALLFFTGVVAACGCTPTVQNGLDTFGVSVVVRVDARAIRLVQVICSAVFFASDHSEEK